MSKIVKLYRSCKRPSSSWGTKPVPDNQLKTLKDLPEGGGNYYLSFYEGKNRQMPSVGRFADVAKQKLVAKHRELQARTMGVELPPETEPERESDVTIEVEKYLSQMMAFVGQDGYGRAKKSVNAYRNRLGFYLRFCAEVRTNSVEALKDYDHLMQYVGWLRKQTKRNGQTIGDRYVYNIFATLGTFALTLDITTPTKKVLPKLGYAKKVVKAHSERELQMLWASCMPDEELLFKFFLWSMGREQEVAHSELGDLDFINNTLHICPKPHRNYRLKSKRNRTRAGSRFGSVLDAGGGQCLPQMEADHDHHRRSSGAAPGAKRPAKFFVSRESAHSLTSRERYRPISSTISPPPLGYGRFRSYARPR